MRLRDLDLIEIVKKIDQDISEWGDWDMMVDLEEVYELWTWHPGMG